MQNVEQKKLVRADSEQAGNEATGVSGTWLFPCAGETCDTRHAQLIQDHIIGKVNKVRCTHRSGDVINFMIVACRISSRLKWHKNNKNRLRLAKVIVKNKMSRFLWFTVYCSYMRFFNSWAFDIKSSGNTHFGYDSSWVVFAQDIWRPVCSCLLW